MSKKLLFILSCLIFQTLNAQTGISGNDILIDKNSGHEDWLRNILFAGLLLSAGLVVYLFLKNKTLRKKKQRTENKN